MFEINDNIELIEQNPAKREGRRFEITIFFDVSDNLHMRVKGLLTMAVTGIMTKLFPRMEWSWLKTVK